MDGDDYENCQRPSISSLSRVSFAAVAKMLSRIFQFHAAFEMEPVIKVRYKLRWLLVLLSVAAAAGQPGNPRKVLDSLKHTCIVNSN